MSEQKDFLKSHFEMLSSTKIQSIEVTGNTASIHFADPSGMYMYIHSGTSLLKMAKVATHRVILVMESCL